MSPAANDFLPDEAAARRLLLARALDEADGQGRLVGPTEKQQADDEALRASGGSPAGAPPDPLAWLQARATRLVGLLEHRSPALAALAHRPSLELHASWLLPVIALVLGGFIDRIDNPRQVNLLSPPLLAFLAWNVAVYLVLLAHAVWPRAPGLPPLRLPLSWRAAGVRAEVAAAFHRHWRALAGALPAQRMRRILHASAAAWGVGVAVSIVLGGLVREYRVGWESTLLELPQVHAVLHWMFAPVAALLGLEPFSLAEVARLHFGSGEQVARPEARRWVALYLGLVALVVIGPRSLLALWAAWRERSLVRALRIDLEDPYYAALLSRVTPARVRLAILAQPAARERLHVVLQQAGGQPPGPEPWTVVSTARGDSLQVVDARALADADEAGEGTERSPWWSRAAKPVRRVPVDVVVLTAGGDDTEVAMLREQAQRSAVPVVTVGAVSAPAAGTLSWGELPTWREDARLWAALARACAAHQRPGVERLWLQAQGHARDRLRLAVQLLAAELAQAAVDVEMLPSAAIGVRHLLVRGERDAAGQAASQATAVLLERVQQRRRETGARLLALHGLQPAALQEQASAVAGVRLQRAVDAPQAGVAGAASGAAVGAGIDLVTGGLTLGAASALGALVGGGAAMAAAAWRNSRGEAGASSVMLDEAALPVLVRDALQRYLAVVHAGRARAGEPFVGDPMAGASAAIDEAVRLLREVRGAPGQAQDTAQLEAALREAIEAALQHLHGDVPQAPRS